MSILAHSLIASLYNQSRKMKFLDWENPNLAQLFRVNMRVSHSGYVQDNYYKELDRTENAVMSIVITGRHRVYVARHADYRQAIPEVDLFVNTSNHDSCWRTDGLQPISDMYFHLAEKVVAGFTGPLRPAPAYLNTEVYLGDWLGENPIQFVEIRQGPKRQDNINFDTLLSVTPIAVRYAILGS